MINLPRAIFVLGPPASGKGTQCLRLISRLPHIFFHLSAGELLRRERDKSAAESSHAEIIRSCILEGKIVPAKITVNLILDEINEISQKSTHSKPVFLIDGYPRNEDNEQGWKTVIGDKVDVLGCLHFKCSENTTKERIISRVKQARESNVKVRDDDNDDIMSKRYLGHVKDTLPIVEKYLKAGKAWEIDAEQDVETVSLEVISVLQHILPDVKFD